MDPRWRRLQCLRQLTQVLRDYRRVLKKGVCATRTASITQTALGIGSLRTRLLSLSLLEILLRLLNGCNRGLCPLDRLVNGQLFLYQRNLLCGFHHLFSNWRYQFNVLGKWGLSLCDNVFIVYVNRVKKLGIGDKLTSLGLRCHVVFRNVVVYTHTVQVV